MPWSTIGRKGWRSSPGRSTGKAGWVARGGYFFSSFTLVFVTLFEGSAMLKTGMKLKGRGAVKRMFLKSRVYTITDAQEPIRRKPMATS
jgi:hypothetical protein